MRRAHQRRGIVLTARTEATGETNSKLQRVAAPLCRLTLGQMKTWQRRASMHRKGDNTFPFTKLLKAPPPQAPNCWQKRQFHNPGGRWAYSRLLIHRSMVPLLQQKASRHTPCSNIFSILKSYRLFLIAYRIKIHFLSYCSWPYQ